MSSMDKKKQWIVAVSGGPDSMVLLDTLRTKKYKLVVAHVNYKKRLTSDRDEEIVAEYCETYGIPFETINYSDDSNDNNNFQHNARVFRYAFFKMLVSKYNANGVVVGHHLDDDVETYVMQKSRNMKSAFVGLAPNALVLGVYVWRPLLSWRKNDILAYASQNSIKYGIDESNFEDTYTRNRVRKNLQHSDAIQWNRLIEELNYERSLNNDKQEKLKETVMALGSTIDTTQILEHQYPEDVLRYWLNDQGVDVHAMSKKHVGAILQGIEKGTYEATFDNLELSVSYGYMNVSPNEEFKMQIDKLEFKTYDKFKISKSGERVEAVCLKDDDFPITVRYALPEDEIMMKYGTKKLNRFFIDRKIPRFQRKKWLVVENSAKHIVFVVGLGCDVHHYANNNNIFVIEL